MTTFKAKLIDNDGYYPARRKLMILQLLALFLFGLLIQLIELPTWLRIVTFIIYVVVAGGALYFIRQTQKHIERHTIEIGYDALKILSKKGDVVEQIDLTTVQSLEISAQHPDSTANVQDTIKDLRGQEERNYICVVKQGETHSYEFLPDSHYMVTQLEKLVEHFRAKGIAVQHKQQAA